ncbi:Uncharacterized protein BM_BM9649 [Brugia malayi]|uniref:Bm9649 n=1 Tax=Brugia malayi TaxID=6279 RepID=A0A0J9XTF2_BRUMA|nr:Uncharacterized protein BM_BM9649 [Brugia malayi]CDP94888.1 Bm9649 [Brugia malayi]VIO87028.1 Uncharacterized protein BM_BM9649 [Brugia malayi]
MYGTKVALKMLTLIPKTGIASFPDPHQQMEMVHMESKHVSKKSRKAARHTPVPVPQSHSPNIIRKSCQHRESGSCQTTRHRPFCRFNCLSTSVAESPPLLAM